MNVLGNPAKEFTIPVPASYLSVPHPFLLRAIGPTLLHPLPPHVDKLLMIESADSTLFREFESASSENDQPLYNLTGFHANTLRFTLSVTNPSNPAEIPETHEFTAIRDISILYKGHHIGDIYMTLGSIPDMKLLHVELDFPKRFRISAAEQKSILQLFKRFSQSIAALLESAEPPPPAFNEFAKAVSAPEHLRLKALEEGAPIEKFPRNLLRSVAEYLGSTERSGKQSLRPLTQTLSGRGRRRRHRKTRRSRVSTRQNA
jgi:hypothetical protein